MKRASALLLALAVVALPVDAKRRSFTPRGIASSPYLDAAKQAANWLASVERRSADGVSWPRSDRSSFASTGLSHGAAGIGAFHLRLYQVTREQKYLDLARGAASFVAAEYRRGREGGYDWQSGAVGGGELFVLMYRETGEQQYLDHARMTADILLRQAVRDERGTHWVMGNGNVYTGIAHGAAGAGVFFVQLYEISGDTRYLDVARDVYRWMRPYTIPLGDGIGWKRLTGDLTAYHGFCGGSSGILYFLDELARATNDEQYRADFIATANGLAASAEPTAKGVGWYYTSAQSGNRGVIYCHGTSCASSAVAHAFTVAGDSRYADLARAAMGHLQSIAVTSGGDGPLWPHIERSGLVESGFQTGAASVGHAFLRVHAALGDSQYLDEAIRAGEHLIRRADRPAAGQMRWVNYIQGGDPADVAYDTGWYTGSAGIGIFLLELHDRVTGRPPLDRFSPLLP